MGCPGYGANGRRICMGKLISHRRPRKGLLEQPTAPSKACAEHSVGSNPQLARVNG
jgi:hypothetical protein